MDTTTPSSAGASHTGTVGDPAPRPPARLPAVRAVGARDAGVQGRGLGEGVTVASSRRSLSPRGHRRDLRPRMRRSSRPLLSTTSQHRRSAPPLTTRR